MPRIALARRITITSNATVVRRMRDVQVDYGRTFGTTASHAASTLITTATCTASPHTRRRRYLAMSQRSSHQGLRKSHLLHPGPAFGQGPSEFRKSRLDDDDHRAASTRTVAQGQTFVGEIPGAPKKEHPWRDLGERPAARPDRD